MIKDLLAHYTPTQILHAMTTEPELKSKLANGTFYLLRAALTHQSEHKPADPVLNVEPVTQTTENELSRTR